MIYQAAPTDCDFKPVNFFGVFSFGLASYHLGVKTLLNREIR